MAFVIVEGRDLLQVMLQSSLRIFFQLSEYASSGCIESKNLEGRGKISYIKK